jgi:hypothetical protein
MRDCARRALHPSEHSINILSVIAQLDRSIRPVFQRRRGWNREAAAYWVARSSRATTAEDVDTVSRSRGTICPSFASFMSPSLQEGAGNAGCWLHPRILRAKKSAHCARKQHRFSRTTGIPRATVLTAAPRSPRCTGLVSHRRLATIVSQGLSPASGGRDHTAWPSAHSIPRREMPHASIASRPAFVTTRTPLLLRRDG